MKVVLRWIAWPFIVLFALARWIGGTFLVASLALFPVLLVAELVFRHHHPWRVHLLAAAAVALVIGAAVAAAAWLGLPVPGLARGVPRNGAPAPPIASVTAQGVASLRAAHQLIDDDPKILDDPVSVKLVGPEAVARITANPARLREPAAAALRTHVLLRSRYAEDRLAAASARGVRQCVIVGAGLDTFAYRQPAWARTLRIFEVDHRASQRMKRDRLAAGGIAIPSNLTYVELDIERLPLRETLTRAGVDPERPAFFSCLGVLAYLTRDAVRDFFHAVAAFPVDSELVFTYAGIESADNDPNSLAARARALGEPWHSRFSADELATELRDAGFHTVEFLTRERAAGYVGTRRDGLEPPRRVRVVSARI